MSASKNKFARSIDETTRVETETVQGEIKLAFADGRYVVYSRFNGLPMVHIRQYDTRIMSNGDRREYPSKKGACFTPIRLKALRNRFDEIDENMKIDAYKTHLGAGLFASINGFNGVDLRWHWVPAGQPSFVPTKRGIFLPAVQWMEVKKKIQELVEKFPELDAEDECFHANQMEIYDCRECTPYGYNP